MRSEFRLNRAARDEEPNYYPDTQRHEGSDANCHDPERTRIRHPSADPYAIAL